MRTAERKRAKKHRELHRAQMRYRNLQRISECTNTVEIIKLMDDADSESDSGSDGLSVS